MAITDIIDGWSKEGNENGRCIIGARLAACIWMFSKAVVYNGQLAFWERRKIELIEDMNRICVRVVDDHVWVSKFTLAIKEKEFWSSSGMALRYLAFVNGDDCGSPRRQPKTMI